MTINRSCDWRDVPFFAPLLFLVLFALFVLVGDMDEQEEKLEERHYCAMVDKHERSDGAIGWPDYKGIADEVCGDEEEAP